MKITNPKKKEKLQPITFRLPEDLIKQLNTLKKQNGYSMQKLVTGILQTAINDKSFKLEIKD